MTPHRYFDRSGRELSRAEALENGHLKDGVSCRVHMSVRDSARSFWDAHRDSLLAVDARRIGGTEGNRPGYRIFDSDLGRQAKLDAYQQYEAELTSAYRNPPGLDAAKPPPDPDEDEELPQGRRVRPVTADRGMVDVDAVSAAHQQNMQRLYDAHAREISEAWKGNK